MSRIPSWDKIEVHPKYKALDDEGKNEVRGRFFDQVTSRSPEYQKADPTGRESMRHDWMNPAPPQAETNVLGAVKDIAHGLTRLPVDTLAAAASVVDDPFTSDGMLDPFIEWNRKKQRKFATAEGADEIAVPGTTVTREEIRQGTSSLGHSAVAMGAALVPRIVAAGTGAVLGSEVPLAGTITGAVIGWTAGAAASGKAAYNMDKNAFVREYREFLSREEGREISDDEFAQYKAGEVADLLHEHGLHEAGWEGIANMIELGTLSKIKGGKLGVKALKGLVSLVGFELGSEAQTAIGQKNVEVDLGMAPESERRRYTSLDDQLTSAREVAPATLLMGGVTTGGKYGYEKIFGGKTVEPGGDNEAPPPSGEQEERPFTIDMVDGFVGHLQGIEPTEDSAAAINYILENESTAAEARLAIIESGILEEHGLTRPITAGDEAVLSLGKVFGRVDEPTQAQPYSPFEPGETERREDDLMNEFADTGQAVQKEADSLADERMSVEYDEQEQASLEYNRLRNIAQKRERPMTSEEQAYMDEYEVTVPGAQVEEEPVDPTHSALDRMLTDVRESFISKSFQDKAGNTSPTVSTSPEWFKQRTVRKYNKEHGTKVRLDREELRRIIDKVQTGKPLTAKQQVNYDYLKTVADDYLANDHELVRDQELTNIEQEGIELHASKKVSVGNLAPGDEVVVEKNGIPDKLTVTGYTEDGNTLLQDGHLIEADAFEQLDIIGSNIKGETDVKGRVNAIVGQINESATDKDVAMMQDEMPAFFEKYPEFEPYRDMIAGTLSRKGESFSNGEVTDEKEIQPEDVGRDGALPSAGDNGKESEVANAKEELNVGQVPVEVEAGAVGISSEEKPMAQTSVKSDGKETGSAKNSTAVAREPWRMTKEEYGKELSMFPSAQRVRHNILYTQDTFENIQNILQGKSGHPRNLVYFQEGSLHHSNFDKAIIAVNPAMLPEGLLVSEDDHRAKVGEFLADAAKIPEAAIVGVYKNKFDLLENGQEDIKKALTSPAVSMQGAESSKSSSKSEGNVTDLDESKADQETAESENKTAVERKEAPSKSETDTKQGDASNYGQNNKLVSTSRAEEIRAKLEEKLNNLNSGVDPEILSLGTELAVYHIESGARKFSEFSKALISDLGEKAKPYLRSWYEGARYFPGLDNEGMSSAVEIESFLEEKNSDEFVKAPDGSLNFGEISTEQAKVMRRQAGKIRLQNGRDDSTARFGLVHIEKSHKKDLLEVKEGKVPELVRDIATNFNEIWSADAGQLLLVKKNGSDKVGYIQLKPAEGADFYTVNTVFRSRKHKGKELLWSATHAQTNSTDKNSSFAEDPNKVGEEAPNVAPESNSSGDNVSPGESEVNGEQTESAPNKSSEHLGEAPNLSTIKSAADFIDHILEGDVSLEEYRTGFESLKENKEVLFAELKKLTIEKLKRITGDKGSGYKKADYVETAYNRYAQGFVLSMSFQWSPFTETAEEAVQRYVDEATPEQLKKYVEEVGKSRDQSKKYLDGVKKAIENPETLADFRTFLQYKKESALTDEQKVKYEDLQAEAGLATKKWAAEQEATVTAIVGDVSYELAETHHAKKDIPLFIVKLTGARVEKEKFNELRTKAKQLGGWYSRYRGQGAIPGFQFENEGARENFVKVLAGETVTDTSGIEKRTEDKKTKGSSRLRNIGERLKAKAKESLNQDRKTNTAKRVTEAAHAEASANSDLQMAEAMLNLAEAIDSGKAKFLNGVSAKTHVNLLDTLSRMARNEAIREEAKKEGKGYSWEMNQKGRQVTENDIKHANFPYAFAWKDDLLGMAGKLEEGKGGKLAAAKLRKIARSLPDRGDKNSRYIFSDILDQQLAEKVVDKLGDAATWQLADRQKDKNRLRRIGITNEAELRAALREYIQYRGGVKKADPVKVAERALVGRKIDGYFPTPKKIVDKLIEEAGLEKGQRVLEPSAGKGSIAEGLAEVVGSENVEAIEPVGDLRTILEAKGFNVTGRDFLEHEGEYDRIVMNPPFEKRQDVAHVLHAFDQLAPGGKLVAIMSEGPFFGQDKKATEFRGWLDGLDGWSEKLPEGAFKESDRSTGVNTRMVVVEKAEATNEVQQEEETKFLANKNPSGSPLSREQLNAILKRVAPRLNNGDKVHVTFVSFDELPTKVKADAKKRGYKKDEIHGAFHNGTTYVVAENVTSVEEVEEAIFHEVYGHYGIRALFGTSTVRKLNTLFRSIGGWKDFWQLAEKSGLSEELNEYYDSLKEAKAKNLRATMVEELLAHISHTRKGGLKQRALEIIGVIRSWLREHGFTDLAKYNNADLANVLRMARMKVEGGTEGNGGRKPKYMAKKRLDKDNSPDVQSKYGNNETKQEAVGRGEENLPIQEATGLISRSTDTGSVQSKALSGADRAAKIQELEENDFFSAYGRTQQRRRGGAVLGRPGNTFPVSNRRRPSTEERVANYNAWKGGSLAEIDSEPMMFYHGSPSFGIEDSTENWTFDKSLRGSRVKHPLALLGTTLTANRYQAETDFARGTKNMNEFFVRVENPYLLKAADIRKLERLASRGETDAVKMWVKRKAELEGHDSIYDPAKEFLYIFDSNQAKHTANSGEFGGTGDTRFLVKKKTKKTASGQTITTTYTGIHAVLPDNPFIGASDKIDQIKEKAGPRWQNLWERLLYNVTDIHDPRKRVMAFAGKQEAKTDILTVERLRGKKTADETEQFMKKSVEPLLKELAEGKVEIRELEEYKYAQHVPERNQQMQRVNAKRYIDRLLKQMTDTEAAPWNDALIDIRSQALMEHWSLADKHDAYLGLMQDVFSDTPNRHQKLDSRQRELDERVWTDKEIEKGTDERLYKRLENARERLQYTSEIQSEWESVSPRFAGITDQEAKSILKKFKEDKRIDTLKSAGAKLDTINQGKLDILYKSGQLSDEEYESTKTLYRHYVPLYRDGFDDTRPATGRPTGPTGKPLKVAKGSMREVVDIMAHTVQNHQAAINRKHKADAGRTLFNFVQQNPDVGITIEAGEKKPTHDKEGNLSLYTDHTEPQNGVFVKVDGQRYTLVFDTDIRTDKGKTLARFLESIKDSDAGLGTVMRVMTSINRKLAMVNTMLSPEFILSNFVRDAQTAGFHLSEQKIPGLTKKIAKDIFPAIKGIFKAERGDESSDMAKWYRDFAKHGGKIGWLQGYEGVTDLAKELESTMHLYQDGHTVKKKLTALMDLISHSNSAVENGVRLATYKALVGAGKSKADAALAASNLTVDFTRHGKLGPKLNALYMFANAGVQGNVRMIKAVSRSKKVQGIVGAISATGFSLHLLALAMGGDDDTGEPYINGIPDFIKERNMIIMIPGSKGLYSKIPMPYGYNGFYNMGAEVARILSSAVTGKDYNVGKGALRVAITFANAFNPLAAATVLQTLAPTVVDPFVQAHENKGWNGSDLMPSQNPFGIDKPDSERYWKSVTAPAKVIAQALNRLTGGDKYESGLVDVSPETLDMMFNTVTGSLGRFVVNTLFLPVRAFSDKGLSVKDIPMVRRVVGTRSESVVSHRYYEIMDDVQVFRARVKGATTSSERQTLARDPLSRLSDRARIYEKRIRNLRKMLKRYEAAENSSGAESVRDRIRDYQSVFLRLAA